MSLHIDASAWNNKGLVRLNNEDNYYLNGKYMKAGELDNGSSLSANCHDAFQVYAVCDGMGGIDSGEEAALTAVSGIHEMFLNRQSTEKSVACQSIQRISDRIYHEAQRRGGNSGTTLAMLLVSGETVQVVNVGDSRVYRFRDGNLSLLSTDHSEVQRLIRMGIITPDEAHTHPKRHVVSQYLGLPPSEALLSASVTETEAARQGDVFLLCSDGLTDLVSDPRIQEIMGREKSAANMAKALTQEALKNGGVDNITVLSVKVVRTDADIALDRIRRLRNACLTLMGLALLAAYTLSLEWIGRALMR